MNLSIFSILTTRILAIKKLNENLFRISTVEKILEHNYAVSLNQINVRITKK